TVMDAQRGEAREAEGHGEDIGLLIPPDNRGVDCCHGRGVGHGAVRGRGAFKISLSLPHGPTHTHTTTQHTQHHTHTHTHRHAARTHPTHHPTTPQPHTHTHPDTLLSSSCSHTHTYMIFCSG